MTTFLLNFMYAVAIDRQTQEPRRVVFFLLYYVIGFFVTFIVLTMVLLCLEVYDFPFARNFIYRELGEHVLLGLELPHGQGRAHPDREVAGKPQ
ncbi:MAG: hypothetical protein JF616_20500 [Fibrobacteres bacterium]|nr:hypothetical protein [Fibrobacterota bacterium]